MHKPQQPLTLPLFFLAVVIFAAILISGCSNSDYRTQITGADTLQELEGREIPAEGDHTPLSQLAPTGNTKGFTAPNFKIKTIDGKTISLQQLTSERPTLVYFFATWCPYCAKDFKAAKAVYPEYNGRVNFLAIDLDPKESTAVIAAYQKKSGLDDLLFAPANIEVLQDYGISATTTKFAIDRNKTILWRGSGEVDEKTWRIILDGLANS
ncbi:TlpA family protein disulfide reductase [Candidatus Woesearchaeota archaeon]|nr:TlpA family protein disulfide reductase [Candidatus Woesearchaeota archaeon]